jgi:hypothetical protein
VLQVVVDASAVCHFAYATARRTLCLDHLTAECELAVSELPAGECPVCNETRRKLERRRRNWWESEHPRKRLALPSATNTATAAAPFATGSRTG